MQSCRNNSENTGKFYPFKHILRVFPRGWRWQQQKKSRSSCPSGAHILTDVLFSLYVLFSINIYKHTSPKSPNSSQLPPWVQHGKGNRTEPTRLSFYLGLFWARSLIRYTTLAKTLGFSLHLSGTYVWSPIFPGMQLWCTTSSWQWKVVANSKTLLSFQ